MQMPTAMPMPMAQQPMPQMMPQPVAPVTQRISVQKPNVQIEMFNANTSPEERRQFVGNAVYPVINQVLGEPLSGRITGMIIDENVVDVKRLLTDGDYLNQQVNEAYEMLSKQ